MQKSVKLDGHIVGPDGVGKKTMLKMLAQDDILVIAN